MYKQVLRLLHELAPNKKQVLLVALTGLIMSALTTYVVIQTKTLFDSLQTKNFDLVWQTAALIVAVSFFSALSRYIHLYQMDCLADKVVMQLRFKLQQAMIFFRSQYVLNYEGGHGAFMARLLNDTLTVQHGLRMVADIFREPILLVLLLGRLFYLNWSLTLVALILLPLLLFFLRQVSVGILRFETQSFQLFDVMSSRIKETLEGIRIIQSFNLESKVLGQFHQDANAYVEARKQTNSRIEIMGPVTEFVATILILSIFVYVGQKILSGQSTLGDFMGYLVALMMLSSPVKKIQESYVRLQATVAASIRVFEIIDSENHVVESQNPKPWPDWSQISFKDVSLKIGDRQILNHINFNIKKNQVTAFVGESGSGKTSLINLLTRFYEPTTGQIFIEETDIKDMRLAELRDHISLVTQESFLFSDSIRTNIRIGDLKKDEGKIEASAQSAFASDFISSFEQGFETWVGDRGSLLSGGERQRISLARAFFKNAPIVILDEATSALDSISEAQVQKGIDNLIQNRTVIVIAHRLSTIMKADQIYVIKNGEIVENGKHSELLNRSGEYRRIFGQQIMHLQADA